MRIPSITMLYEKTKKVNEFQVGSFESPAHGCGRARATIEFNNSPSAKKSGEARKQAGKKKWGWGEGIFARLLPFPFRLSKGKAEGGFGGNSATPEQKTEASPAERRFCVSRITQ